MVRNVERKIELLSEAFRVTILVGHPGSGKTEVVRRFLRMIHDGPWVYIARRGQAGFVEHEGEGVDRLARQLVAEAAAGARPGDLIATSISIIERLGLFREPLIVAIDGVEKPEDLEDAVNEASRTPHTWPVRFLLLTRLSPEAFPRLYTTAISSSAAFVVVGEMEPEEFKELYDHYSSVRGCSLTLEEVERLVGRMPGGLVQLCAASRRAIEAWEAQARSAAASAIARVAMALGAPVRDVAEIACDVLGRVVAWHEADKIGVARLLAEAGLAYTVPESGGLKVTPTLGIYRDALCSLAVQGEEVGAPLPG